jgi:PAS domain S-box-containing protein
MRWLARLRGYVVLGLAALLFAAGAFLSVERMLREQEQISQSNEINATWVATQAQAGLLRAIAVAHAYGAAEPGGDRAALGRSLDALLAGLESLGRGELADRLRGVAGADATIARLVAESRNARQAVAAASVEDRAQAARLSDALRGYVAPLADIVERIRAEEEKLAESRRLELRERYMQLLVYFFVVFLSGSVLVILLLRGIRNANRLLLERSGTEERLRESEQRFRDYAAASSDWLWETDAKGRFTYFSKGYLEKVGLNAVQILGRTHEEIADTEGEESAWAQQRVAMAQGQAFRDFRYRMRAEGGIRHIKVSGVPIFDAEGAFLGYRGTGTDLTPQIEAENEAARARSLLSEAVESLNEGFAVFDSEDRLVQCNSRFREFFGSAADAVVPGAAFESMLRAALARGEVPDATGREDDWIADRLERHWIPGVPCDIRLRDGRWIRAAETRLANGWRVATRIETTHHKRREEELTREALIWEQMSDGVLVTDLHGNITNCNPAAERMFGYRTAELMGKTPRLLYGPANSALLGEILEAVLREGGPREQGQREQGWTGEIGFLQKDGRAGTADTLVAPLRDERGNRFAIIWVHHDITLRKQGEAELLAAKEQAELANQAKSLFLATMSHEIRTPMNGVLGMVELLLETKLDQEQRTYAETARESSEALVTIIDDILDFSKMEAGKLELENVDLDLRQVVESVVDLLAPRAQDKGIEIGSYIDAGVPSALTGDPGRLRQVLLNLAGNAVKFTEQGGVSIAVSRLRDGAGRATLRFEVADTGIGIPESVQEGLFAEFTQVDPSYARRYGGTGLGLAISKRLAERMGGEIGFSSKAGAGSTFWFTASLAHRPEPAEEAPQRGAAAGARALVIDDNPVSRRVIARQLSAQGLESASAADLPAALAALGEAARAGRPFAFALVDQALGEEGGEAVARAILGRAELASVKRILLLPVGGRLEGDAAQPEGFDAVLNKPVRQMALAACLARLMGKPAPLEASAVAGPAPSAAEVSRLSSRSLGKARLLLVEDSQVNRMVALAMLTKVVGRIDTARNGVEAVEGVKAKDYDLILMDVAMPEMDGLEATRLIRAMPGAKGAIPIIAMTAHAMDADRQRCLAAGMDDYITKPVDRPKLLEAVAHWVERGSRRRNRIEREREAAPGAAAMLARPAAARPAAKRSPLLFAIRSGERAPRLELVQPEALGEPPLPAPSKQPQRRSEGVNGGDGHAAPPDQGLETLDTAALDQLEADTGASVVQDLVKTFILETVDRLDRIARAADARDIAALEHEAHSLKSSSGTFGARALQERAKAIETACRAGNAEAAFALTRNIREVATTAAHAMVEHFEARP